MGTFWFLLIVVSLSVWFYIDDTKKHKQLIFNNILETHFKEKELVKETIIKYKEKYPALTEVILSFTDNNSGFREIVKSSKKVEGNLYIKLSKEIDIIISSEKDEDLLNALKWYLLTSMIISSVQQHSNLESLNQEADKIIDGDMDRASIGNNLCII